MQKRRRLYPPNYNFDARQMALTLFCIYSRRDEQFRNELEKHLAPLRRSAIIAMWYDRCISPGQDFENKFDSHLKSADIIVLLVTPDLLISEYVFSWQFKRALERHERGECRVVPIVLRPCDWQSTPILNLLALPRDGKPVATWPLRDEAWLNVAKGLRLLCEQWLAKANPEKPQARRALQGKSSSFALYDVFRKSGVPTVTFVEPSQFTSLVHSIEQPGRGVVIEGPTGIGKTTAVLKALEKIDRNHADSKHGLGRQRVTFLTARKPAEVRRIRNLPSRHKGIVVIDDVHRLAPSLQKKIVDYLKYLADTEPPEKKLVVVGIPNCAQRLVKESFDVATRIDVYSLGKVADRLVIKMIEKGEDALNVSLERKAEIALIARGSLNVAQYLCHRICEDAGILVTQKKSVRIKSDLDGAVTKVVLDLGRKFTEAVRRFATLGGSRDSICINVLDELRQTEDGFLSLVQLRDRRPDLAAGIARFIQQKWMDDLIATTPEIKTFLYFDAGNMSITMDDPQLAFYLRHISLRELERDAGKAPSGSRQRIFICYSHKDAHWLKIVQTALKPLVRNRTLMTWADTNIPAGIDWRREIEQALASASIAVLVVTPEFLASDFIAQHELPRLLDSAKEDGLKIIWIAVSASLYEETEISRYQPANDPSRPLDLLSPAELNAELVRIAKVIKSAVGTAIQTV